MLGLGETREEVLEAMAELAAQGTDILTLGQYLQPTREHLPVVRYVHPDEFAEYKRLGEQMGFATWKPGRWCAPPITPSSRKKPRAHRCRFFGTFVIEPLLSASVCNNVPSKRAFGTAQAPGLAEAKTPRNSLGSRRYRDDRVS